MGQAGQEPEENDTHLMNHLNPTIEMGVDFKFPPRLWDCALDLGLIHPSTYYFMCKSLLRTWALCRLFRMER